MTIAELRRLSKEATPRPWVRRPDSFPNRIWADGMQVAVFGYAGFDAKNAAYAAAACNHIDAALDLIEKLQAEIENAKAEGLPQCWISAKYIEQMLAEFEEATNGNA